MNWLTSRRAGLALSRRTHKNDPQAGELGLKGPACPNHVGARSDHDALFQGSVEPAADLGKAEILDQFEAFAAQHFGEVGWIEKAKLGLAQRSRPFRNRHHIGAPF